MCKLVNVYIMRIGPASGGLLVDEAADASKSVSNSNNNAALFALMPQYHSSTDWTSIVTHRRAIEDKLMGSLGIRLDSLVLPFVVLMGDSLESMLILHCRVRTFDLNEATLSFRDSGHGGDKRKRCQPCSLNLASCNCLRAASCSK